MAGIIFARDLRFTACAQSDWLPMHRDEVLAVVADAGPKATEVFKSLVVKSTMRPLHTGEREVHMAVRAPMGLGVRESRMIQRVCQTSGTVSVRLHKEDKGMLFADLTGEWIVEEDPCTSPPRCRVVLSQSMKPGFPIPGVVGPVVRRTGNHVLASQVRSLLRDLKEWTEAEAARAAAICKERAHDAARRLQQQQPRAWCRDDIRLPAWIPILPGQPLPC